MVLFSDIAGRVNVVVCRVDDIGLLAWLLGPQPGGWKERVLG